MAADEHAPAEKDSKPAVEDSKPAVALECAAAAAAGDAPLFLAQEGAVEEGCVLCGVDEDPDQTLLCDGPCGREFHLYCLEPPLADLPEGDWYC
ncbi:hypothetical protein JKP88DRAFT_175760, partial [Tribonema minus]